jgi:hypothetical protein
VAFGRLGGHSHTRKHARNVGILPGELYMTAALFERCLKSGGLRWVHDAQ